jgi:cytochrome c peroxidase
MLDVARAATLQVEVRPTFNGEPLLLDSLRYQNAAGETLSISRLSYLLSGFGLERADGSYVELPGAVAWLDAAQHRTAIRLTDVPAGSFRAVRFQVGPDAQTNAGDPAKWPASHPLNANLNNLYWGWQGGYIFLALEGHFRGTDAAIGGYAMHLARDPNRTCIRIEAPLDLEHDSSVLLDFDLAALLDAPHPLSFVRDGTATHSRGGDPVSAALVENLPGAFHLRQVISTAPAITLPSPLQPLYLPAAFTPYRLVIARTFPIPDLPRDNPLIEERVTLGRKLFHDSSLSRDGSISCASCHQQSADFSDPRRFSVGVSGQAGTRHALSLSNLAWKTSYMWDGRAPSLRAQALIPMQDHAEMDETLDHVVAKLTADASYPALFQAAFGAPEITVEKIGLALENYLLTLTSCNAKFDRSLRGQASFTDEEKRGFQLFTTEYDPRTRQHGADCFHCHGGPLFSDHQFHNNGLTVGDDPGRSRATGLETDRGKFMTPSLRNVARRGPYMHDGRFSTLAEVIAHYDHGVSRSATLDPNLAKHPPEGLLLSAADQRALVAFLQTLSDE